MIKNAEPGEAVMGIDIIKYIILGVCIIILNFSNLDSLSFAPGSDESLIWAFNYFFEKDLDLGKGIFFPHGPLCFLTYPLANNIVFALVIKSLLQLQLVVNIFLLSRLTNNENWLMPVLLSVVLLKLSNFNLLLISTITSGYLFYTKKPVKYFSIAGVFLTAFAFYVKSYVAVISGLITFSFICLYLMKKREYKFAFLNLGSWLAFIVFFWLMMYGSFEGLLKYGIGIVNLSMDNSAAASYYPLNDWTYLSMFIIGIILLPFIQKTNSGRIYAAIVYLGLFAAWKHGMAREDISHVRGFIFYTVTVLCFFMLYVNRKWFTNLCLSAFILYALCSNWKNVINYEETTLSFMGVTHFNRLIQKYESIKSDANNRSIAAVGVNRLPGDLREKIGNSTVDIYPWELSLVPANYLNWQPRPVIQSYASYTSWLDKQNADHFKSDKAPEFIIWKDDKGVIDFNGGTMKSIDNRYILNDEPQSVIQMFNHYSVFYKDKDIFVLKRHGKQNLSEPVAIAETEAEWNKWVGVPALNDGILRAKIYMKGNLGRALKSFLYKDEAFYIYYYLTNGDIWQYKIVPKNAQDGIWINPFIKNLEHNFYEPLVEKIQIRCSNKNLMKDKIKIVWEKVETLDTAQSLYPYQKINSFFGKNTMPQRNLLFLDSNDCEASRKYWSEDISNLNTADSYSGKQSYMVKSGAFSISFKVNLDSLLGNTDSRLAIKTTAWVKGKKTTDAAYITVIGNDKNNILWKSEGVRSFIVDEEDWNYMVHTSTFDYTPGKDPVNLHVYFWNTGYTDILIDDLKVKVEPADR